MGTINPSLVGAANAIAHSRVIHAAASTGVVKGSELNVAGHFLARLTLEHGYVEDAADTNPGYFLIRGSIATSGNDSWVEITRVYARGTDPDKADLTATEGVGETEIAVSTVTGFAVDDLVYIQDTNGGSPTASTGALSSPETNSEWGRLIEVGTSPLTLLDGLTAEKDSNDDIYNDATRVILDIDVTSLSRMRVDFIHTGAAGANCDVRARVDFVDEYDTA